MASGARAHYRKTYVVVQNGVYAPVLGASVNVYKEGTVTPIGQSIFQSNTGAGTYTAPLTTDANGVVEFWLDQLESVDLAFSGGSPATSNTTITCGGEPFSSGP